MYLGIVGQLAVDLSPHWWFYLFSLSQVLPFYATSLSPEEEEQVASLQTEPPSEALAQVRLSPSLSSQDKCTAGSSA